MKDRLTKEIAEKLYIIVKTALEKGSANYRNLPPLDKRLFSNLKEIKNEGYIKYFEMLKNYSSYIEIGNGFDKNEYNAKPNEYTKGFHDEGGFANLYRIQEQKEQLRDEIDYKTLIKLNQDIKLNNWKYKTRWLDFIQFFNFFKFK